MKRPLYALALPVMLALAACRPGAAEYTESEAPKLLGLDSAGTQFGLAFAPGSARLAPGEGARLHRLALSGTISHEDRVTISASGAPRLQQQRAQAISSELLGFGIVAAASPIAGVARDRAIVAVGRYMVTLPACPNWSKAPNADFTNALPSNFGCATASNLGLMAASPSDLVSGRPLGPADGRLAVSAVQRYISDSVKIPQQFDGAAASPGSTAGGALTTTTGGSGGGH
jgi:pilus assembly protein CpaD